MEDRVSTYPAFCRFLYSLGSLFFVGLWLVSVAWAQEVKAPRGVFLSDSVIKIGERVQFALTYAYPANREVRFPDSVYKYSPFELIGKSYFVTTTRKGISYDSAVYTLTTFETDSVQYLRLPVMVMKGGDTTLVYTDTARIIVVPSIISLPEKPVILTNTEFKEVKLRLNYPYIMLGLGILLVLIIIVYLLFGERIRRSYALRRLQRRYDRFVAEMDGRMAAPMSDKLVESVLSLWKSYLEGLHNVPYTSYTSKEIMNVLDDEKLLENLKVLDRAVYGRLLSQQVQDALTYLQAFAREAYQNKIDEVKNA
jgi:hypothetical protein